MRLYLAILALHCYADFCLQIQGNLHELKQKEWWGKVLQRDGHGMFTHLYAKFGRDWVAGMTVHAVFCTIVTFAPIIYLTENPWWNVGIVVANSAVHWVTDHLKANMHSINLRQDQFIHFVHITLTYIVWRLFAA